MGIEQKSGACQAKGLRTVVHNRERATQRTTRVVAQEGHLRERCGSVHNYKNEVAKYQMQKLKHN